MLILAVTLTFFSWILAHWVLLSLAISEALAFIPGKYKGIAKAVWEILQSIFKKSSGGSLNDLVGRN